MREFTSADGRRVVIEEMAGPDDLVIPFDGEAHVAVVWASDDSFDAADRQSVATTLIESGCRYIVCGGMDCEHWHDDADMALAVLEADSNSSEEKPMVMTTWHAGEAEKEVISFAFSQTNFGEHEFKSFLVLVAGAYRPGGRSHMAELFLAQCRDGVDLSGAPGGDEAGS